MEKLELRLLGPVQFSLSGKPLAGLVSAKAKALLFYLAMERRPCSRSSLAGLLWSDFPEDDARRNLRVEIAKLRQWLDPYLAFTRQDAAIQPGSPVWIDVHEFEDCLLKYRLHGALLDLNEMHQLAILYRGDFLSGFHARAAPLFEEWVLVERERLRQMALDLLDKLVEVAIQQRDWKIGLSAARKSISIDSWREQNHRQLMKLLALSGDRSAALFQFETTRRILVQELGVEPGPETLAIYQRIKDGDFRTAAEQEELRPVVHISALPPPHNLPAPTTPFIGREAELEQITDLLTDPGCRLLTLTGPGGAGKTRLVLELCWKLTGKATPLFKDGIYFIPLASVNDPEIMAPTIASALNISLSGSQEPQTQLALQLGSKQMLLVLDNFEQLDEAAPGLVELLRSAPDLKMLITSRHQLNLYEEWVFPVEGMPYPLQIDSSNWHAYSAVQLFQLRARRVNLRFSSDENREWIIRICQLLEGLPLGIELAAAWVNVLSCADIVHLIEQNLSLPEDHIRNLPGRQRSLQAVFQYSWDLLSPEEQEALAKLSVFQGGFTIPSAEAVIKTRPRVLASLAGKSLLRFPPNGRYEMHNLLQAFSKEKLVVFERVAVQAAHSQYFAQFLTERAPDFAGPKEAQAIEEIATEINNVRLGWQWAIAEIPASPADINTYDLCNVVDRISQYTPILSTFYFRMSWFREAEPIFSQAATRMEAAGFSSLQPESRAPYALGLVYLAQARHSRALGQNKSAHLLIQKGLHLLAHYPDSSEIADAWHILGQIEQQTGALAAAEEAYQHSLRIYRNQENPTGIASTLVSLGVLAKNSGDLNRATELYTECLAIFQQRGDQRGIWTCLINLGNIANVQQDFQEAKRLYEQAYRNVQNSTDKSRQALTLLNLGSVAREVDETRQALGYYSDSLRISEEIGEVRIQAASLDGLGKTCLNRGEVKSAWDYLLRALQLAREANLLPQALDSLAVLAHLVGRGGQLQQALELLAYVLAQPSCPDHVRQYAEREVGSIKTKIPAGAIAGVVQEFQGLPLDGVIGSLATPGFLGEK